MSLVSPTAFFLKKKNTKIFGSCHSSKLDRSTDFTNIKCFFDDKAFRSFGFGEGKAKIFVPLLLSLNLSKLVFEFPLAKNETSIHFSGIHGRMNL